MKITASHVVAALVSLIVGIIGALALRARPHPPFDAEGTNAILVGPRAKDVSIPNAYLRQDATHNDQAVWVAADPHSTLYIDFHVEIFDGMTHLPSGLYRVQCTGARCDSGPLKSGVPHTSFKYDQTLIAPSGKTDHEDGRIIIKP